MARVVCQVLFRPGRLTFLWSDGTVPFEPYHKTGTNLEEFQALLRRAGERLHGLAGAGAAHDLGAAGVVLAHSGYDLYRQLFRADLAGAEAAQEVQDWFEGLAGRGGIDRLQILTDAPDPLPWTALTDVSPDEGALRGNSPEAWQTFWSARLPLTVDRRVNPLARRPDLERPSVLLVIDPAARAALPGEQQGRLEEFAQSAAVRVVDSARDLADGLKVIGRLDVLYLFCRVSGRSLHLGDEAVPAVDLRGWLQADAPPGAPATDTFVFLNACRAGDIGGAAGPLPVVRELGPRAFVAPHGPVAADAADRFGLDFLRGLLTAGEPLGDLLPRLRRQHAPLGLVYAGLGPAALRVRDAGRTEAIQAEDR